MMPLKGKRGTFWEEQGGSCLSRIDLFQKAGHTGHEGKVWGDESILKPGCGA